MRVLLDTMFDNCITSSLIVCKETIPSIVFVCQSTLRLGQNSLTKFGDCLHHCYFFVGQAMYVFYTGF